MMEVRESVNLECSTELTDLFSKFRNNDPDGDGEKDTYGISGKGYGSSKSLLATIYGAFGIMPGEFVVRDGEVVFADMTDDYKKCLTLLQSWYKDELLDPETVLTSNPYNSKFWDGVTGALRKYFLAAHKPRKSEQYVVETREE